MLHASHIQDEDVHDQALGIKLRPEVLDTGSIGGVVQAGDEGSLGRLLAQGGDGLIEGALATTGQDDLCGTCFAKGSCNGEANTTRASGYENDVAFLRELRVGRGDGRVGLTVGDRGEVVGDRGHYGFSRFKIEEFTVKKANGMDNSAFYLLRSKTFISIAFWR